MAFDIRMRFLRKPRQAAGWLALAPSGDGDGMLAAVVVRHAGALPQVTTAGWFASVASVEALEKAGRELRATQHRSSCLLAAGQYQMLSLDAPAVPADELKTAVRWMLKDMLDYHVDDATIDVLAVPYAGAGNARAASMFAVAARNSLIEARQKLFAAARIPLSVIDVPEMAQRNIAALLEAPGRALAMLSFGAEGALLTVTYEGELFLARRLEVALAELLERDEERRYAAFDKLTLLLQRSLDHVERQFHTIALSRLVLAPSLIAGLDDYLGRNLYTPVHALDLHEVFDLTDTPDLTEATEQQRFFLTLGAALRHEEVVL